MHALEFDEDGDLDVPRRPAAGRSRALSPPAAADSPARKRQRAPSPPAAGMGTPQFCGSVLGPSLLASPRHASLLASLRAGASRTSDGAMRSCAIP